MGQTVRGAEVDFQHGASETPGKPLWERRHSFRVQVPAHASVLHKGKLCGYYLVQDVSIGGCSLSGTPILPVGEHLDLLLHLPHRAPLALSAKVRRSDALTGSESRSRVEPQHASTPVVSVQRFAKPQGVAGRMGLRFEQTPAKAEDCIQDFVVETFASAQADDGQIALVVEPRHVERQMLVRTLRELGRRAIGVATALDAVQLLGKDGEHIDTVFIEAESASLPSLELVEFLAHNYPRVRRVLVGESSEIAASWVAQATGEVHALLETPCDQEAVHRVLHRLQFTPNDGALS
jgi:CheY-like chemotaxis protein